jgi:hypothetical protein
MTQRITILIAAVCLAVAVAACGDAGRPDGSPGDSAAADGIVLRYTCGTFPFGPELLTAVPGNAEQAANPAAGALRAHLAGIGPDIDFLPDTGWTMTGMNDRVAEFVSLGGDLGMKIVSVENGPAGWKVSGWGDCQPRIALAEGLGEAEWAFDPAQPKPGAATQVFDAMVTEMNCNGGQPADGRIVGPQVVRSDDTVLVIFAVRPRPGAQTCPSNPSTRIRVDLGEPLGDRTLMDGGRLPPGDPAASRF